MAEGYQIRDQGGLYYLTFQVINWIDVFSRQSNRDIISESFRFCQKNKGLNFHAYVIMSNHVHCILSARNNDLSDVIRDMKTFTSKEIIRSIQESNESRREWMLGQLRYFGKRHKRNSEFQFLTHENHPMELLTNHFMDQKLDYIHMNPIRAGIVEEAEHYIYSSAASYAGKQGILEIEFLE